VEKVVVVDFDGSQQQLHLKQISLRGAGEYGYAGFAVRGAWCASELQTYDKNGNTLWDADATELAEAVFGKGYKPAKFCPR
jgi:hypothetical protein